MNPVIHSKNEQAAGKAFDKQASIFDELYSSNIIIQYKRQRVRDHVMQYLPPAGNILELNSGTGEDAVWFAQHGYSVHATDISEVMLLQLKKKIDSAGLSGKITSERCSYTALEGLQNRGPYDYIFSNFAGLNCTGELEKVLKSFSGLLKPGGKITLVILPAFCLWETLLLFKGKFKTAFRRFFSKNGAPAHIEGKYFTCWYYNPSFIIRALKNEFRFLSIEGLCTVVPPSYLENFPIKYPGLYSKLMKLENRWKSKWPWRMTGDYYIISLEKKD
ncbi:MAG TPA: class I SAM-dependent methyltransferase [Chitinophagaceae bacterium]|nr:class I SAM-dependent methyltransferase [Chitinophagaceae bacterium]